MHDKTPGPPLKLLKTPVDAAIAAAASVAIRSDAKRAESERERERVIGAVGGEHAR